MSSGILMTGLVPKGVIFHAPTTEAAFGAARAGCSFAVSTMSDLRASAFPVKIRGPKGVRPGGGRGAERERDRGGYLPFSGRVSLLLIYISIRITDGVVR